MLLHMVADMGAYHKKKKNILADMDLDMMADKEVDPPPMAAEPVGISPILNRLGIIFS